MFRSFLTTPEMLLLLSDEPEQNEVETFEPPRERGLFARLLRLTGWR
ncbi:hypothetical protein [Paraburkholderia sp. Ac-20347]|jgi:hypothetical protein|nr:hypothetical protein [Paraburkholderia sp. Ac-20347]MBN3811491.1 hypothetical protein [Paraburkholderia sp. Ac-20347]